VDLFEARFRAKSSFAAAADRQLRVPLTMIMGGLETLQTAPIDEGQRREFVDRAALAAQDLLEQLDRLAVAPPDPDPVLPRSRTRTVPVIELVERACVSLRDALPTQRIVLHCDSDARINTDPPRF